MNNGNKTRNKIKVSLAVDTIVCDTHNNKGGKKMLIGYARVSTQDQNLDRQIDQLTKMGCERIYYEKITGTKKDRPELKKLLDNTRKDDVIVITDLTRLS